MWTEKTGDIEKFDQKKSELSSDELREKYRELNKNFKTELAPVDGGYGEKLPDRKITALDNIQEQVREDDSAGTKEGTSAFRKVDPEKEMEKIKYEAAFTTIDNVSRYFSGEISIGEMARNIFARLESLAAEARVFITEAVAEKIRPSVYKMIDSLGELGLPEEAVSAVRECFESLVAFAEGKADIRELGYDLSDLIENVLIDRFGEVIAKKCGGAWGYLVLLAFTAAVDKVLSGINAENVQAAAEKMREFAKSAIDTVAAVSAEGADTVRSAINTFFRENGVVL